MLHMPLDVTNVPGPDVGHRGGGPLLRKAQGRLELLHQGQTVGWMAHIATRSNMLNNRSNRLAMTTPLCK